MIKLQKLVIAGVIVCLCSQVAIGEPPSFAPYGAWRGRIRYVEGPWRTRTSIRWGNGVTPTGGQVLIQGIGAAQTILTDPNFLSNLGKVVGLKEAEKDKAAESTAADELAKRIGGIRQENEVMLADLNKVLASLGLPEQEFQTGGAAVPPAGPAAGPSPEEKFSQAGKTLVQSDKETLGKALQTLADGQALIGNLANGQDQVRAWNSFASEYIGNVQTLPPPSATDPSTLLSKYRENVVKLASACDETTKAAIAVVESAKKLPSAQKSDEKTIEATTLANNARKVLDKVSTLDRKLAGLAVGTQAVDAEGTAPSAKPTTPEEPASAPPQAKPDANTLPSPS